MSTQLINWSKRVIWYVACVYLQPIFYPIAQVIVASIQNKYTVAS